MTLIGKMLAWLNLILGVGIGVWGTAVFTQRPGWFDAIPDSGVDKGNSPISFPQLTADIDVATRAALAASKNWGDDLKTLKAREATRAERYNKMFGPTGYVQRAKKGGTGPAFVEFKEDETTRLIDLDNPGPPITVLAGLGEQKVPLRGADTLLDQFNKDAETAEEVAKDITKLRAQQKLLAADVVAIEQRLLKQGVIRENLYNESIFLAAFEVNVAEQRDTVTRRRQQLRDRLAPFRAADAKTGN